MRALQLILIAVKAALLVGGIARGEVVSVVSDLGDRRTGYGTGMTSGEFPDGKTAIFTAGHNVEGAKSVQVTWEGGLISAEVVCMIAELRLDVAVLAVDLPTRWTPIYLVRDPPKESPVVYFGFKFNRGVESREYQRRVGVADISRGEIPGSDCIYGNSGGPVIVNGLGCVGLIRSRNATGYRDSLGLPVEAGTNFTPSHEILAWVDQQRLNITAPPEERVQCIGGRCYYYPRGIVIRQPPVIVQPPPLLIEQQPPTVSYPQIRKPIVPPPPREDAPACQCKPTKGCNCSAPTAGASGAPGPQGPRGPKGERGDDATCTCESNRKELDDMQAEIKRLKSTYFPVRTLKPDGSVFSEDEVRLLDPIEFRLVPKANPNAGRTSSN